MTIGTTLLTTLNVLIAHNLIKDTNSVIRNFGLVLCQFIRFTEGAGDDELCPMGENGWRKAVVKRADEHGFRIKGTAGIDETIETIREEIVCDEEVAPSDKEMKRKTTLDLEAYYDEGEDRSWKRWDWKLEVRAAS